LAVNRVGLSRKANLAGILEMAAAAVGQGAEMVLFPEAALTGLINDDDPELDLPLGEEIPGPLVNLLSSAANQNGIWLGIGLLERDGERLYDSAVLLDPQGRIALKYRRISPGWHGTKADPRVYCHGNELPFAETPFGRLSFLICGDLFDDEIAQGARGLKPDLVLVPFARNFEDGSWDAGRWEREERGAYAERAKVIGSYVAMVNYLSEIDGAFGGAMIVSPKGDILCELSPGVSGILVGEIGL